MRWSQAFIPTLRDDPTDAEAPSHRLLVRAGFIRQLMAGSYSLLPLGMRSATKLANIVREEIDAIGGQEFLLPVVHPAEPWRQSGRWDNVEEILVKFKDRREADLVLAMTHEEIFTIVAKELKSYKELPQLWYHIQTKFRDEARPKAGLLRVREFSMKDSYSFDIDTAGLDAQFERHRDAYTRIFARIGMTSIPVEASSGAMGGSSSVEFMVPSDAGEDWIAVCPNGDYAANLERATSTLAPVDDAPWEGGVERFATPGLRTIASLADAHEFAAPSQQIKSLVYVADGETILVLLRGDHDLEEQKLADGLGVAEVRPADEAEIVALLGAHAGSLGPVGVEGARIVADPALCDRRNMVTGANEDDWHVRGVDVASDVAVDVWLDVRRVVAGDACPVCGAAMELVKTIEVGHIFKLGTKYSDSLGLTVLDENGAEVPVQMGSYGIGIGRNLAAVVEANHDEKGIIWPASVAPYTVVLTVVKVKDEASMEVAERLYADFRNAGIDVLLDDRDERPGVKFNDAELIGFPFRVTIGPRGIASGLLEVTTRSTGETRELPIDDVVATVASNS